MSPGSTVTWPFSSTNSSTAMMPSDLYPTSTITSDDVTLSTVPLTTSPSAMLRKLSS